MWALLSSLFSGVFAESVGDGFWYGERRGLLYGVRLVEYRCIADSGGVGGVIAVKTLWVGRDGSLPYLDSIVFGSGCWAIPVGSCLMFACRFG